MPAGSPWPPSTQTISECSGLDYWFSDCPTKGFSFYTNLSKADWTKFTESEQNISCQLALRPLWLLEIGMKLFARDWEVIKASNKATLRTCGWSLWMSVYLRMMPVWKWYWAWFLECAVDRDVVLVEELLAGVDDAVSIDLEEVVKSLWWGWETGVVGGLIWAGTSTEKEEDEN